MNNIAKDVRHAVWGAISTISYSGGLVPCYLIAPDVPTYPYIQLMGVSVTNESSQTCVEAVCSVDIEVVSAWVAGGGGFDPADDIETLIVAAVGGLDSPVANKHFGAKFVSSSPLTDFDGSRVIVRRRLEFTISTQDLT